MSTRNSPRQIRRISVEALESRLNLSTLAPVGFVGTTPAAQAARATLVRTQAAAKRAARLSAFNTATLPTTIPAAISTGSATDTGLYGATTVGASSTSIPVSSYSSIYNCQLENNGQPDIGWVSPSGAYVEYTLNVQTAGNYNISLGTSEPGSAQVALSVNGSQSATYALPSTNSWSNFSANTTQSVYLPAGTAVVRLSALNGTQYNLGSLTVAPAAPATPAGPATTVGSAGSSVSVANYSAIYNCQLENNGQPDIGWVSPSGAYVEYTLNVQTAGNYNVVLNSSEPGSAQVALSVNGSQSATYSLPSTNSWSNFSANTAQSVYLPAGTSVLRLSTLNGTQYNLGGINIAPIAATTTTTASTATTTVGSSAASVPVSSYSSIYNCQLENNGQPDIGYVSTSGSYVEYKLNVQTAGNYSVAVKTASPNNAQFNLSVNGTQAATYNAPGTGSWSIYGANTANSVYLPAGTVTIRLASANGTQYNIGGITVSPASSTTTNNTTTTNTSNGAGFDASVSTQWMTSFNQLNIVAGSQSDSIYVTQSGSTINVNVNGVTKSYSGSFGDIVVKAGSGSDNITIDGSVSVDTLLYGGAGNDTLKNFTSGHATIVSIGGGYDTVQGNGINTAYWTDASDGVTSSGSESNAGDLHKVSSFWNGVSTTLAGQTFTEPTGTGATTTVPNASFWGTGPTMADINQGQVSDCYLLGPLQTMANTRPDTLRQLAVDLGDGTYAVQFKRNGATTFVRVDGQLPSNGYYANGLMYAHPGASGDLWAPIIEKAYAEFRTGSYNYSDLGWGYFGTVLSDFGVPYTAFGAGYNASLYSTISNAVNSGKGVTIGTNPSIGSGAPLIGSHTYTVTAAWTDSSGTQWVTLRNPWGMDGAGSDSNTWDGFVTMTISQLGNNLQGGAIS